MLLSLEGTQTHETLSRQSHCISYCSCSHQLECFDYYNSVLYGAPHYVTHKLQRVQNSKLFHQNRSPVRQSSPLRTSSTATSFVIINQSVLFAPLTSTFLPPLYPALTSVLVLFVRPLQSFGTQYPSQSVHLPPSTTSNAA